MFDMSKMQEMMDQVNGMQSEIKGRMAKIAIEGSAGGDSVRVVVNANKEITKIELSPDVVKNPPLLADLILAAANDAYAKVDKEVGNQLPGDLGSLMSNVDMSQIMNMLKK